MDILDYSATDKHKTVLSRGNNTARDSKRRRKSLAINCRQLQAFD
jgi:hypothetical protein